MRKSNRQRLFEQDSNIESNLQYTTPAKSRKSEISVDDQIDGLILMYEKVSIRDEDDRLQESLSYRNLNALLFEQDEAADETGADDAAADPLADAAGDDAAASDAPSEPEGSEATGTESADKDLVPDLDIDNFTKKVARLMINHRSLLSVEQVILNRAKNFLDENYGDAFVSRFLQSLDQNFGIESSEFNKKDKERPFAIGANPAGAGNVGGG